MKNKTKAKLAMRRRKPTEQWPRFFRNILEQLNVTGDDPVFITKADITPETQYHVAKLMAKGLLLEEHTNSIPCISCYGPAPIQRKGAKGEIASALCPYCGAIFRVSSKELMRWRADWNSFGFWLKNIAETDGEMEKMSPLSLFLGHVSKGQERFEIYVARLLTDQTSAQETYSAISQTMTRLGIVISLARNFSKSTNPKITVIPLSDCLVISGKKIVFKWPEYAFSGKDQAKQRAGLMRAQNDPCSKQKENLKAFVRRNITSIFRDKYHPKIADEICKNHTDQITYMDSKGKSQQLSRQIILDAIAEVMDETGLDYWISGRKHKP